LCHPLPLPWIFYLNSYERLRLLEKTFHDKEEKILALPAFSPEAVTKHPLLLAIVKGVLQLLTNRHGLFAMLMYMSEFRLRVSSF